MPTSRPLVLNFMASQILNRKPKSFLDIGVGFGKNGFLAREYMDIWDGPDGCWDKANWRFTVDGIEVFNKYVTDLQRYIYDNIYIGDAAKVIKTLDNYDFAVCTAMLEHVDKDVGLEFLEDVKVRCNYTILTVPIDPGTRGQKHGNPNQAHVSKWTRSELSRFGSVRVLGNRQFLLEMS